MLTIFKTTLTQKLFRSDYITLYILFLRHYINIHSEEFCLFSTTLRIAEARLGGPQFVGTVCCNQMGTVFEEMTYWTALTWYKGMKTAF